MEWHPAVTIALRNAARLLFDECRGEQRVRAERWVDESRMLEERGEYGGAARAAVYAYRIASGMNHYTEYPISPGRRKRRDQGDSRTAA